MNNRLIVIEGPAGSGKSTALHTALLEREQKMTVPKLLTVDQLMPEFERPRSYDGGIGAMLSELKDQRTLAALTYTGFHGDVLVADRWQVSSRVYDAIRDGDAYLDAALLQRQMVNAGGMFRTAAVDFGLRLGWDREQVGPIEALFIFVQPTVEVLQLTRATAEKRGRVYPYAPELEVELYRQAAFHLDRVTLPNSTIRAAVAEIDVDHFGDPDAVAHEMYRQIDRWLSQFYEF